MANGRTVDGFNYEDISDPVQVPTSDLAAPESVYLPLARLAPNVNWERVSLQSLLQFLATGVLGDELDAAAIARQVLRDAIAAEVQARQQLEGPVASNTALLEANTHQIGLLSARIAALEQAGGTRVPTSGSLTFGIRNASGTLRGSPSTELFAALPATVAVTFPAAVATTDRWFFRVPIGVTVSHIWNTGIGRRDELATWQYDASTRTYTYEEGITVGAEGSYEIAIVASGG